MFDSKHISFCLIATLAITLAGCGKQDDRFEIHGKVSFESQPIAEGKILFMPVDESRSQAIAKIVDGEYTTASPGGVFAGDYKVQVFGYKGTGKMQDLGELYGGEQEQQVQFVPTKYNQATELTLNITTEQKEYDFDLE